MRWYCNSKLSFMLVNTQTLFVFSWNVSRYKRKCTLQEKWSNVSHNLKSKSWQSSRLLCMVFWAPHQRVKQFQLLKCVASFCVLGEASSGYILLFIALLSYLHLPFPRFSSPLYFCCCWTMIIRSSFKESILCSDYTSPSV